MANHSNGTDFERTIMSDEYRVSNDTMEADDLPPLDYNITAEEMENFNVTEYLASILGPQRQPSEKVQYILILQRNRNIYYPSNS